MKKFEFKRPVEEIEIAGDVYTIDFSDVSIQEKQKKFETFHAEVEKIPKDAEDYLDKVYVLIEDAIDTIFHKGAFKVLYEKSGRSLYNMTDLMEYLADMIGEKANKQHEERVNKYLKAKKQKKETKKGPKK